jgi:carbonic anhydrase
MSDAWSCTRTAFMLRTVSVGALLAAGFPAAVSAQDPGANVAPDDALSRLMEGNKHYVSVMVAGRVNTIEERASLGDGQAPFASILTCADSRTSPEILFTQGLGDIFVVRVAGNVAASSETASLEFGSAVLGSQLILVMGHSGCGAVKAAIDAVNGKPAPTPDLVQLTDTIAPAVRQVQGKPGDLLVNATKANALLVAENLRKNELLGGIIAQNKLKVVASYVDLKTGVVSLL